MNQFTTACRVVVIDDNSVFRIAAEKFLRALGGVEVAGLAADGLQGIDLVDRVKPDAVILDINMPGLNGFEVATRLQERMEPPGIILVSVDVDHATRSAAYRRGIDDIISKADFVELVPRMLEGILLNRDRYSNAHGTENEKGST